jgi:transcriptional antiterminator NusG
MVMTQPTPPAPAAPQVPAAPEVFKNRIFAVKTTSKQERTVADNILKAIDTKATDIKVASIIVPNELQGYVLIETPEQRNRIEQLVELIAHARVVTKGETTLAEVGHFLIPKPVVAGIDEGTIVELIAGLYESVVPIPITVRGDNVRVVEKFADR